jgi:hypothetical protein
MGTFVGTFSHVAGCVYNWCKESVMGVGKGALLWLIGVPLPIIILLVLFWR